MWIPGVFYRHVKRPVRVGVQLWQGGTPDYATWRAAVLRAEAIGTDAIFGYDHFHRPALDGIVDATAVLRPEQPDVNNFEGWTALASWGEITKRAEIGLMVTGIAYRNPDLLADMARTVDHISGGRLILGLGTGWYEKDYATYGYQFGTLAQRLDLFDVNLRRIDDRLAKLQPAPKRPIPVLIGGGGERRTLPAVARHAHIWHTYPSGIADYRRKSSLVDELAEANGRLGTDIERSVAWTDEHSGEQYLRAGVTLFTVSIHPTERGFDCTTLERLLRWRDALSE